MVKRWVILWVALAALAACGGGDDATPIPTPMPDDEADLVLRPDVLPISSGHWVLDETSIEFQEREAGLILAATYRHLTLPASGRLHLTVFRRVDEARQVFDDQVRAGTYHEIPTLGDAAYRNAEDTGGVALVLGNGVLQAEMNADTPENLPPDYDLLNLVQIGVDVLSIREPAAPRGTLGSATLAPPG